MPITRQIHRLAQAAVAATLLTAGFAAQAADTATINVSATVTGTCRFQTATGSVAFALDPSSTTNATGTVTNPSFWCTNGSSWTLSDDNGVNKSGTTYRLKLSTANEYIPYTFSYTSTGTGLGKTSPISMNIAASVLNADFVNATVGTYADTVVISIIP